MELGAIVSWKNKEGDKLNKGLLLRVSCHFKRVTDKCVLFAGDLLAEIQIDEATMDFETPDEG